MRVYCIGRLDHCLACTQVLYEPYVDQLWDDGHVVVGGNVLFHSPHDDIGNVVLGGLRDDLTDLVSADAVALLPGWQDSPGAVIEEVLARSLGLSVYLFEDLPEVG